MNLQTLSINPNYMAPSAWWQHVPIAHWLIGELRPARVVELGSHYGVSFFAFCEAAELLSPNTFVYAVDTWAGDEHAGYYSEDVYNKVIHHWESHHRRRSRMVRSTFDDAVEYFEDKSIDILHIDGLHTYAAVKHDFETWLPKLKEESIVLFHDINVRERGFGVWQLWEEIKNQHKVHEVLNGHGLGILVFGENTKNVLEGFAPLASTLQAKGELLEKIAQLSPEGCFGISPAEQARTEAIQAKADADQAKVEADQAKAQAHQAKVEADQAKAQAHQARTEADQAKADAHQAKAHADRYKSQVQSITNSNIWRITGLARRIKDRFTNGNSNSRLQDHQAQNLGLAAEYEEDTHRLARIESEVQVIRESGLFDSDYYIHMYPDCKSRADAIRHYCERGWRQGYNPSDTFDTQEYLDEYSDIKDAGLNPFWHFVTAGKSEARRPKLARFLNNFEDEIYFGDIESDLQVFAYYASYDQSTALQADNASEAGRAKLLPHEDLSGNTQSCAATLLKQAQMARRHGIAGWCFSIEFTDGGLSNNDLENFLSNKEIQINFILDISLGHAQPDSRSIALLERSMSDERYLRFNDKPVLVVSLPCDETIANTIFVLNGLSALIRQSCNLYRIAKFQGFCKDLVSTDIRNQFDAFLEFPVCQALRDTVTHSLSQGTISYELPYSVLVSKHIKRMDDKGICSESRYQAITTYRYDLKEFRRWLIAAINNVRALHKQDRRLIFIDAWNDWRCGAVLEPERLHGYKLLNETSRALLNIPLGLAMPKVSIIVPNYNHARYLRKRLDSIYRQTYRNVEVLLLDDCSTDQSREILIEYADQYPEISRIIFNQSNSGGVFRQWSKGIKEATGDLVWIAESDDYCDSDFLEVLVRCFADQSVMLAYSRIEFVRDDESSMPDEFWHHVRDLECRDKWRYSYVNTAHHEVSEALGIINTIPNASGAIFRCPIEMPLLEDEAWLSMRVAGDWIFYLHQLRGGKIAYSTETTSYFRRYDTSSAANSYKSDAFFRELCAAGKAVQSLYETPDSVVDRFLNRVKFYYGLHIGGDDDLLDSWCNACEILQARQFRFPNIAVSTMGFYPGGAEILPIRMANEFKRQGYSVLLLSAGHGEPEDGVRRLLRRDIPLVETPSVQETKLILDDFNIEVLNSHQWHIQKYPLEVPDVFKCLKCHIASLHGMIEYGEAFAVTSEQLRIADESVSVWAYTADKNLQPFIDHGLYQHCSERFIKLPNGINSSVIKPVNRSELGIPDNAFVLCCVSRAIPEKGWAETIQSVSLARDITGLDIRLILVGNGPVYDEYFRSATPSYVYLAGFSDNSVGFYASSDIGIMLTKFKSESFPLTIVDCLFAGRSFIATSIGEIKNMLTVNQGVAGEVIDLVNWHIPIDKVAKAIALYATDPKALEQSRRFAREAANRYKIDNVVSRYSAIIEFAMQNQVGKALVEGNNS